MVDTLLKPKGSVYDLDVPLKEVKAEVAEAERIVKLLENELGVEGAESAVNAWYDI